MLSTNQSFYLRFNVALSFFVISAAYGWLLRLQRIIAIPLNYSNILQAHSHVTFLGWGFLAVISIITYVYFSKNQTNSLYKYPFWIMTMSLIGMLISFPIQGYKLFSIILLTIFLLTSYIYLWQLFKAIRKQNSYSVRFIKTGIIYYYLSSLAIWAIAIISVKIGKNDLYHNAIYFYLHFLYNGFFVFSLFGLFLRYFENKNIILPKKVLHPFYVLTNIACIPAYALSLLWNNMPDYVVIIGFFAAILQLVSLFYLRNIIKILKSVIQEMSSLLKIILALVLGAYYSKILLQFMSAFPIISYKAVLYKPYFLIGYIHLFTLGFMSLFLFLLYAMFTKKRLHKSGMYLFITGILLSEVLLFFQGGMLLFQEKTIPNFEKIMWMVSFLMPLGLMLLLFHEIKLNKRKN